MFVIRGYRWRSSHFVHLSIYLGFYLLQLTNSTWLCYKATELSKFSFHPKYTQPPFLFFGPEDHAKLLSVRDTTHYHIVQELIQAKNAIMKRKRFMPPINHSDFTKVWNERYGNNLPPFALYTLLYPDDIKAWDKLVLYMDRMASYPDWGVVTAPQDEVPLSHSLVGFVTALDIIYTELDKHRRRLYVNKVVKMTQELYKLSLNRWWGNSYLQNHVATNCLALLIGSLFSELFTKEATSWKIHAIAKLHCTMSLLREVSDGSLDEGVTYGGYTARSLTQFTFLAKRHTGYNYADHPWLRSHFDFYYYTILPGMQETIGVADSVENWWYGPESQLVYLDTFVIQNGSANWLAQQIRKSRTGAITRALSQAFTTLHTEYFWYNPDLLETPPHGYDQPELHIFDDWGVATYRSGRYTSGNETHVMFKSSKIRGQAIFDLVQMNPELNTAFNPGHEHPDQNSFTFTPFGKPFITEGLYGPKFSHANNVLLFKPSNVSSCITPWAGQLGDCGKWLRWTDIEESQSHGQIISGSHKDGILYMSGEAAGAYHSSLGLTSVYRALVLLQANLLMVVDHIVVKPMSPLTHLQAVFNNRKHTFQKYHNKIYRGLEVDLEGDKYRALWVSQKGQSPYPEIQTLAYKNSGTGHISLSNVNVSFRLEGPETSVVYLFYGPDIDVKHFSIKPSPSSVHEVVVKIEMDNIIYHVGVTTEYASILNRGKQGNNSPELFDIRIASPTTLQGKSTHSTSSQPPSSGVIFGPHHELRSFNNPQNVCIPRRTITCYIVLIVVVLLCLCRKTPKRKRLYWVMPILLCSLPFLLLMDGVLDCSKLE